MNITRRDALVGATAAAVVTGAITAPLAIKAAGVKARRWWAILSWHWNGNGSRSWTLSTTTPTILTRR